jgi:hypothetical protein
VAVCAFVFHVVARCMLCVACHVAGVSLGTDRLRDADAFIAMRADDADDASSVGAQHCQPTHGSIPCRLRSVLRSGWDTVVWDTMPAGIPLAPPPLACVQRARASRVRATRSLCGAGETEYDAASIVGERVSCSGRSLSQFNLGSDAVPICLVPRSVLCVCSVEGFGFACRLSGESRARSRA